MTSPPVTLFNTPGPPVQHDSAPPAPGRCIALLDVENLAGGHPLTSEEARNGLRKAALAARIPADAHLLIGSSNANSLAAAMLVYEVLGRRGRIGFDRGLDAGERALLDLLGAEGGWPSLRARGFTNAIIGSGDGLLASAARDAAANGIHVTVVCPHRSLSSELRKKAEHVCGYTLPAPPARAYITAAVLPMVPEEREQSLELLPLSDHEVRAAIRAQRSPAPRRPRGVQVPLSA